ncbi:MAG: hypothetical protein A2857_01730 [Candidatus Levybacteria bacterium RIFCSPHIGHO2_01_FULL_36_15]|nr:MAG: hypothetical protein A2857_01730 [Candidatus Levybacteria bacterium RIFCSPHIGHO2_01_FULL_36_15]OGH38009.1 MAG: hypothetical protein A2905_05860 [Candidatus Levybacteria bacterium RIFCSPLOWO2_01_FULL_36_10]
MSETQLKILDIAMNLNRIGNWAADGYDAKKKRIVMFLGQTSAYIKNFHSKTFQNPFKKTFDRFKEEYSILHKQGLEGPKDPLFWAEQMMTWGNILTHRVKLINF